MYSTLRPYVTTGVAVVGASVIAVAPITPTLPDVQVPNPAVQQVERPVQLAANIEESINALVFIAAKAGVSVAELATPLVAPLLERMGVPPPYAEPFAKYLLASGFLGLAGPLISGPGAVGHSLQNLIDNTDDLESLLLNLLQAASDITDGFINGGYGPDLRSLIPPNPLAAFAKLAPLAVLAGGLIGPGLVFHDDAVDLAGTIPTIQGLIKLLFGSQMTPFEALAAPASRPIADGVNALLFVLAQAAVSVAQLATPLVEQLLGLNETEAETFLAVGTLGLLGPLIGGVGGLGHGIQDLFGNEDLADFLVNVLDVPVLTLGGAVNGGQGPNLASLLGLPDNLFTVLVGGLINPGNLGGLPVPGEYISPGTIPILQGLVTQLFGTQMLSAQSANLSAAKVGIASADLGDVINALGVAAGDVLDTLGNVPKAIQEVLNTALANPALLPAALVGLGNSLIDRSEETIGGVVKTVIGTLPEDARLPAFQAFTQLGEGVEHIQQTIQGLVTPKKQALATNEVLKANTTGDGPSDIPNTHRPRLEFNVLKPNPLDQGAKKDGAVGTDGTTGKHRLGNGNRPVRDVIKHVLGQDKDKTDTKAATG
jgi:hypothetical protein